MKIILNSRVVEVSGKPIPYSKLCDMVGLEPFFNPTVTYHIKGTNGGGSIIDGTYLTPEELMIVNVMMTNNA